MTVIVGGGVLLVVMMVLLEYQNVEGVLKRGGASCLYDGVPLEIAFVLSLVYKYIALMITRRGAGFNEWVW